MAARHMTRAATRAPRRALPQRRALCTNSKKPRYSGSFSCEMPRCGRSQERSKDHVPSIVLTWISQKPSPSSSRHLVARIRQESSRIRHLWRLTDSEVSSLFSGLAYPCSKVTEWPFSDVSRGLGHVGYGASATLSQR